MIVKNVTDTDERLAHNAGQMPTVSIDTQQQIHHMQYKEAVLRTLLEDAPDISLLEQEVGAIVRGVTNPDYFEFMAPAQLEKTARRYAHILEHMAPVDFAPSQPIQKLRQEQVQAVLQHAREVLAAGKMREVRAYLESERKVFGMAQGYTNLQQLCDLIRSCANAMCLPRKQSIFTYTGTFNPFPHLGHLEVAKSAMQYARGAGLSHPRLVISTFGKNHWKPESGQTFQSRLNQLHNGFFFEPHVTICNVAGSTADSDSFKQQRLVLELAGAKKLHFVIGSDMFISYVRLAMEGHAFGLPFFTNPNLIFYVSHRPQSSLPDLLWAIRTAMTVFGRTAQILSQPEYSLSGTDIRKLSFEDMCNAAPNDLVRQDLLQGRVTHIRTN